MHYLISLASRYPKSLLPIVALFLVASSVYGQATTGRESVKAEMNLTDLARYYAAHPETPRRMDLENDDDNQPRPPHAPITDMSLIHGIRSAGSSRSTGPLVSATLPISPYPTDTFEAVFDAGTAIPPDTHGAVDSNYCMTTINTTVSIQTRAGALAIPTVTLNQFFNPVSPANSTFDPRVSYDQAADKWIVVCVDGANNTDDSSSILIAISKNGDPTGSWWMYKVRAYTPHTYWLDFPDVGFNGKWVTVTGNLFQNDPGTGYNGAKVFVFDKASLLSGAGAPYTSFVQSSSFTICPAITLDAAETNMFAVESWDGSAGGGGQMQLWKISGAVGSEVMTSVGFTASTGFNWQSTSYAVTGGTTADSDFAPQAGTTELVRCNDDRVDQMIQMNGKLWYAHTVFLPYSTSVNASRSSIQWFQTDTLANPIQVGTIDDNTGVKFFAFPTLAVNTSNDALVGFSAFSGTTYPSSAYALHMSTDAVDSMRPLQVYRHGQNHYYKTYGGQTNRWGDYSGTVLDPINNNDFWTIQEASSSTANDWDTWWANVKLCSPPAAISGALSVCEGLNTYLTDDSTGGTWTSSATGTATIGSTTGIVTGVAHGTSVITYMITGGCTAVATVVVNPLPATIGGASQVCQGSSTNLTDLTGTGTWSSSNTVVATIGAGSGTLTGASPGTAMITYTLATGCLTSALVTVNVTPAPITGTTTECAGTSNLLNDFITGGTWTSSNTTAAMIGVSSGSLAGVSAGTSIISYTLTTGCFATTTATILQSPTSITGATSVCVSYSTTLGDGVGLGAWSSSNTAVAPIVSGSGLVTGASVGSSIITYTLPDNCYTTTQESVLNTPSAIVGPSAVCVGSSISLSDPSLGGAWSSPASTITINTSSGFVTGVSAGTAAITYTLGGACTVASAITVNPSPGPISGATSVCVGYNISLTDPTIGGVWSSSNAAVASVTAGSVTGVAAGTAVITYNLGAGCISTYGVTVTAVPTAITGGTTACASATTLLGNGVSGGVWTSSNTTIATIDPVSGLVSGVATGTSIISYTLSAGCYVTTTVTMVSSPTAITGSTSMCIAGTSTLGNSVTGGTWTSSNTSVATIDPVLGTATAVAVGTSTITYTIGTGCFVTTLLAVTPATSAPITGATTACIGQTTPMSDATSGGAWSTSDVTIATIDASGIVTGVGSGSVNISYSVVTACGGALATKLITVSAAPVVDPVTAAALSVCSGATINLSDASPFGVWSSSNTAIAAVGATGIVSGVTAGSAIISYSITGVSGCTTSALATVTVTTPLAAVITASGPTTFCTGGNVQLTATPGSGLTYQWMYGGVAMTDSTNSEIVATTGGSYSVEVNSGSGCISLSPAVNVTVNAAHVVTPTDAIAAMPGNVLCLVTSPVTFTASSTNGGSSPAFQWFVNGSSTALGTTYSYTPANGDIVTLKLTSNDLCAFPDTAETSVTMSISPYETPAVSISANPGTALCTGEQVTLTAEPVYGGPFPQYLWTLNGTNVATGPVYIVYTPVNADVIVCKLTSDFACLTTNAAVSSPVTLAVTPADVNTVTISVSQSIIGAGAVDTFYASAPYPGSAPAYQWLINGIPVPGATSAMFYTSSLLNGEIVSCEFTSSDACADPHSVVSGGIVMHVGATGVNTILTAGAYNLEPNPNKGSFTITGNLKNPADDQVTLIVTDMLGQTVFTQPIHAQNGTISNKVELPSNTANGVYLVNLTSGSDHVVFHIVVDK